MLVRSIYYLLHIMNLLVYVLNSSTWNERAFAFAFGAAVWKNKASYLELPDYPISVASFHIISLNQRKNLSVACFGSQCNEDEVTYVSTQLSVVSSHPSFLLKPTCTTTFFQMMLLLLAIPLWLNNHSRDWKKWVFPLLQLPDQLLKSSLKLSTHVSWLSCKTLQAVTSPLQPIFVPEMTAMCLEEWFVEITKLASFSSLCWFTIKSFLFLIVATKQRSPAPLAPQKCKTILFGKINWTSNHWEMVLFLVH